MAVTQTTRLVWTGKYGVQGSFWGLPQSSVVFASTLVSWITKGTARRSYRADSRPSQNP